MPKKPSTEIATTETPEVLPAAVSDDVLDQVAAKIRDLHRTAALTFALEVGRILVEDLYGGDLDAWQARGAKDSSFRKLAEREDLGGLGKSALHRSVQVYALYERLERPEWKHLGLAHVRAVLPLPDKEQGKLLARAEEGEWTTRKLEAEVAKKKDPPDGRGRPPLPTFVKSIHALGRVIDDDDGDPFADLDKLDAISTEEAEALWKTVTGVKLKCEDIQKKLAPKVPGFAASGE